MTGLTEYQIPYGHGWLSFNLPEWVNPTLVNPNDIPGAANPYTLVEDALLHPVGEVDLKAFHDVGSVAIAISDKTRPVPHRQVLPPLLEYLKKLGIPEQAFQFYIGTGTHPVMAAGELSAILPVEILSRYKVLCHQCDDQEALTNLGRTSRGTPVWVNKQYAQADLRIVVGMIEPHQFQGFSGGVKGAAIGLAGRLTINHNHSMMSEEGSRLGCYERNPARQDVEEIGEIIGVHFALNVILNYRKEIVRVIAGQPREVMVKGVLISREINQVQVEQLFDLVIASPGGHPKDINVYQAQKALAHATLMTRAGGSVILAAACPEGIGSRGHEEFMSRVNSHQEVIDIFQEEGFQVGAHKALQIAQAANNVRIFLVSDMPSEEVRGLLLTPMEDINQAISKVSADLSPGVRVAVMPRASSTIPQLVAATSR